MIRARDPAAMAPGERVAEIADVFALGYLRRLARETAADRGASPLAQPAQAEAPCGPMVDSSRSPAEAPG